MSFLTIIKKVINKIKIILRIMLWKMEYGNRLIVNQKLSFRKGMVINISENGKIEIGKNTFFNNYCSLNSHDNIMIGEDCLFGENVKIYDHDHIFNTDKKVNEEGYKREKISIGNNCWIGSNVIVLKGASVGNNCVISCGCIIRGIIPDDSIVKLELLNQKTEKIIRKR